MNILLTSIGRRTYMVDYFRQALRGEGLVFASNSIPTYSLEQADGYAITPGIHDERYIDFLLAYCIDNQIKVIISLFDMDLPVLSENKSIFEKHGIAVIVSDEEAIKICNDKWLTYELLNSLGIQSPKTYLSIAGLRKDLNKDITHFPLLVKPRWGMGSFSVYQVNNITELKGIYNKVRLDIADSYLKHESKQDIENCVLIQEKIIGKEYGVDILNDLKGNYVTTIAKRKLAMRAGETDVAEIVDNTIFLDVAQKISNSLKHVGNLDVDCFVTEDDDILVLEMNCRFGGQYPFSHLAGANFPAQIISWIKGGKTDDIFLNATVGIRACKDLKPVIWKH